MVQLCDMGAVLGNYLAIATRGVRRKDMEECCIWWWGAVKCGVRGYFLVLCIKVYMCTVVQFCKVLCIVCTVLRSVDQLCTVLCSVARLCTVLCSVTQVCTTLCSVPQ